MSFISDTVCEWIDYVESNINHTVSDYTGWVTDLNPTFILSFFRQPSASGTFLPFSPFVAKKLLKNIPQTAKDSPPRLILEAGAGSGAISRHIVDRLGNGDKLVLVEYDKQLADTLKELFQSQINQGLVEVHNAALQDTQAWNQENRKFDVIVSTIPLNSLPSVEVLQDIFQAFKELAKPSCYVDFGEYVGTSTLRDAVSWSTNNTAKYELTAEKIRFFEEHLHTPSEIEIRNFPPARVVHCILNCC